MLLAKLQQSSYSVCRVHEQISKSWRLYCWLCSTDRECRSILKSCLVLSWTARTRLEISPFPCSEYLHGRKNGASIGARGNQNDAGTLGGWMALTRPNQIPVPVAITCYHVIKSYNNPSLAYTTDRDGIKPSDGFDVRPLVETRQPSTLTS